MTPDELKRIRERAEAATPGPWDHRPVANFILDAGGNVLIGDDMGRANAQFIAAARTDVPALCDALEAAWAERDSLRARWEGLARENDRLTVELATEQAHYDTAEVDIDRLRARVAELPETIARAFDAAAEDAHDKHDLWKFRGAAAFVRDWADGPEGEK